MPRQGKLRPPKWTPTGPLRQSSSQLLSDVTSGPEGQSRTQFSLDNSFASTDNTSITKPTEDSMLAEPILVNQAIVATEMPVQLEVEVINEAGSTIVETRAVLADQVL
jgi:hypothetical protein